MRTGRGAWIAAAARAQPGLTRASRLSNGPTNTIQALTGLFRVDGDCFSFMGAPAGVTHLAGAVQTSSSFSARQTKYVFQDRSASPRVQLTATFTTPSLAGNLTLLSWPVTYLNLAVSSLDNATHTVELYLDNTGEVVSSAITNNVTWNTPPPDAGGVLHTRIGVVGQKPLSSSNDIVNWGYFYTGAVQAEAANVFTSAGPALSLRDAFSFTGKVPPPAAPVAASSLLSAHGSRVETSTPASSSS